MQKVKSYFYYLIWFIIAILLLHAGNKMIGYVEEFSNNYTVVVWIWMIVPFIYGLHFSFLNGIPKKVKLNLPVLLFVFIPSFFTLMYPVFAITFETAFIPFLAYVSDRFFIVVIGIISGLSLMKSLFEH